MKAIALPPMLMRLVKTHPTERTMKYYQGVPGTGVLDTGFD